jgi:hypothetical protein
LFKKNASMKERANAALASLRRNAYAMGILRSKLESRINFSLNQKGGAEGYAELTRVLELVKTGEMILHEMSEKIETARFLEEFAVIMDSAASSVRDIKEDLGQMVPAAEAALEEIHDAISRVSTGLPEELIEPGILAEVTAALAAGRAGAPAVGAEAAPERVENEEEPEPVPA